MNKYDTITELFDEYQDAQLSTAINEAFIKVWKKIGTHSYAAGGAAQVI